MIIWIFAISFFLILGSLVFINYRINKEFKIETSWLALSLAPVLIWLLSTNQLTEFSGFGLGIKLQQATAKPLSLKMDGDRIRAEQISRGEKEGVEKIKTLIGRKVAAVTLKINKRGYYDNAAIRKYLKELTPYPFFKYVLLVRTTGEFVGIVHGSQLLYEMQEKHLNLVRRLETGNVNDIPGVSTISIHDGSSKQESLQLMDKNGLSELPVINDAGGFIGIVERNKITSSIVAQLVSHTNK